MSYESHEREREDNSYESHEGEREDNSYESYERGGEDTFEIEHIPMPARPRPNRRPRRLRSNWSRPKRPGSGSNWSRQNRLGSGSKWNRPNRPGPLSKWTGSIRSGLLNERDPRQGVYGERRKPTQYEKINHETRYQRPNFNDEILRNRKRKSPRGRPFRRRGPSWDSEEAGEGREYPEDRADMEKDYYSVEKEAIVNSAESEYSNENHHQRTNLITTDNFYE